MIDPMIGKATTNADVSKAPNFRDSFWRPNTNVTSKPIFSLNVINSSLQKHKDQTFKRDETVSFYRSRFIHQSDLYYTYSSE